MLPNCRHRRVPCLAPMHPPILPDGIAPGVQRLKGERGRPRLAVKVAPLKVTFVYRVRRLAHNLDDDRAAADGDRVVAGSPAPGRSMLSTPAAVTVCTKAPITSAGWIIRQHCRLRARQGAT